MSEREIIPVYRIYDKILKYYLSLDQYFVNWDWLVCEFDSKSYFVVLDNQDTFIAEKCSQKPDKKLKDIYLNEI